MKRFWACLCLCCCLCAAPLWSFAAAPAGNTGTYEVTELWTGDVLTASFRMGMCFAADGKLRGVVLLRSSNGQVDVYHVYGSVQNNTFSDKLNVVARSVHNGCTLYDSGQAFPGCPADGRLCTPA